MRRLPLPSNCSETERDRTPSLRLPDCGGNLPFVIGRALWRRRIIDVQDHPMVWVSCLDPLDGRPIGKIELPANTMPEESFRDLAVFDEGGVLYALRTEQGVTFQRYDCR